MSSEGRAVAGLMVVVALCALTLLQSGDAAGATTGSCGTVVVGKSGPPFALHITKGHPPCSTVRRIARLYGHPTNAKPGHYCASQARACVYNNFPEGWRCGELFQGTFSCWHGDVSPLRAGEVFDASQPLSRKARELAANRPQCTVRALAKGLHHGGLQGQVSDTFGCAGRFAYAGVSVHHGGVADEITVLFRAGHGHWHPVSRARFCESGEVPKKIYKAACESN